MSEKSAACPQYRLTTMIRNYFVVGLFTLRTIDANSANLFATRRLVGYYGNYTLTIVAEDGGEFISVVLLWQLHSVVAEDGSEYQCFVTIANTL